MYAYTIICFTSIAKYRSARSHESTSLNKKSYKSRLCSFSTSFPTFPFSASTANRGSILNRSAQCLIRQETACKKSCSAWLNSFRFPDFGLKYLRVTASLHLYSLNDVRESRSITSLKLPKG